MESNFLFNSSFNALVFMNCLGNYHNDSFNIEILLTQTSINKPTVLASNGTNKCSPFFEPVKI